MPGPSVRRLRGGELPLDSGFHLAADDRGGESGELERGLARPPRVPGRDDEARDAHRERLGERVFDEDAPDVHRAILIASRTGSPGSPCTG